MITLSFRTLRLKKKVPLRISRGTSTGSVNLFCIAEEQGVQGIGECAPGTGFDETLAAEAEQSLSELAPVVTQLSINQVVDLANERQIDSAALAALDIALWDLRARQAGLPLWKIFGLSKPSVPTSVTLGISPPDYAKQRVPELLAETGAKALKIKLGNPEGIEADQACYDAARAASEPFGVKLRVDANGGWNLKDALLMDQWLSQRDCDYVEQPLERGNEVELIHLHAHRKLPLYLDESIRTSRDVASFHDRCDGVNLKLMKTGGLTEALRLVATARAHGLSTMIGCMGESSIAIAAGCAIGALFDHIDLDSHLNLDPDPAEGLGWQDGIVVPSDMPGHGCWLK
ncbi:MAG: dipeptide epimerase [Fimbriimonadaceae bacterium]|jgi:L-alanine-DL-glutamate epimerase-like enolase superfamily enzyme|nr:dipeptide epimerase [Fimbriimonadaceae bacterium]